MSEAKKSIESGATFEKAQQEHLPEPSVFKQETGGTVTSLNEIDPIGLKAKRVSLEELINQLPEHQ